MEMSVLPFQDYVSLVIWSISILTLLLTGMAVYSEYVKAKLARLPEFRRAHRYQRVRKVAILIASKNGEKTIARSIAAAKATRRDVYLVSDGSTDATAQLGRKAGVNVLELRKNLGKPAALYRAYKHFKLGERYHAIAIFDDDVVVEKDFIRQAIKIMDRDCAISVGKNITEWPDHKRWNMWLASRAYSYWAYQITLRTIQSSYNVMNCISGSNSLYRTEVLNQVLTRNTPYIVDDTYWSLETHRLQLGTIKYAPKARAWLQDPTSFHDWYKQNLRWMWGTFQGIRGHRIGTQANRFHLSYVALMIDWVIYIGSAPLTLFVIWQAGVRNIPLELVMLCAGYAVWVSVAAAALKRPRLLLFIPAIVVTDFLFRWIMVHGFIKALRQPTVESCKWESPTRFDTRLAAPAKP